MFDVYRSVTGKSATLVLPAGTELPKEAKAIEWRKVQTRPQVLKMHKEAIAEKGYSLTNMQVSFTELLGRDPA